MECALQRVVEALKQRCRACAPGFSDTLAEHVQDALHRLGENYDEDAFLMGVARCMVSGSFCVPVLRT